MVAATWRRAANVSFGRCSMQSSVVDPGPPVALFDKTKLNIHRSALPGPSVGNTRMNIAVITERRSCLASPWKCRSLFFQAGSGEEVWAGKLKMTCLALPQSCGSLLISLRVSPTRCRWHCVDGEEFTSWRGGQQLQHLSNIRPRPPTQCVPCRQTEEPSSVLRTCSQRQRPMQHYFSTAAELSRKTWFRFCSAFALNQWLCNERRLVATFTRKT